MDADGALWLLISFNLAKCVFVDTGGPYDAKDLLLAF
jgi:hypothetical protein